MKDNASAADLWSQVFANLAKAEHAALQDPTYDSSADEEKLITALREAGWSENHIKLRLELHRADNSAVAVTSPGVNPHVEIYLNQLCDEIEAAMDRLNLNSHAKVARGVEPRAWASASKINVVMTEESIITVTAFLFRFCGLVARAFVRTLQISPHVWEGKAFNERTSSGLFARSPEVMRYWMNIYLSYAMTGTHMLVPYKPAKPTEVVVFEQIARAMEIFVLAHEYGHHDLRHGKRLDHDPHAEEFQADQFALKVGREVERFPLIVENPYILSGAGGVILLLSLETLRAVEGALGFARVAGNETHPSASQRISKFDSIAILQPQEFAWLRNFRIVSERIMREVHRFLVPSMSRLPNAMLREASKYRPSSR